ncbi:hypothetical protein Neosp_012102 [[Neocosmospora] mangrovei]
MSQPERSIAGPAQPIPSATKTFSSDCALLLGESGPIFASGKSLALSTERLCKIYRNVPADGDPWLGFGLVVPSGEDPVEYHKLLIKFPHGKIQTSLKDAPEALTRRFPNAKGRKKGMTVFKVFIGDASASIHRSGYPTTNADDIDIEGWMNDELTVDGRTPIDILRIKHFCFVLPLPLGRAIKILCEDGFSAPMIYPPSISQTWNPPLFKAMIAANKGHQFMPAFDHPNDSSHITAIIQGAVQDVMWIDDAVNEILKLKFPAYFVSPEPSASEPRAVEDINQFYIVVALTAQFCAEYEEPWRRLTKGEGFRIQLFDSYEASGPHETWDCKITEYSSKIDALKAHPIKEHELVLRARRPSRDESQKKQPYKIKTFPDRDAANDALAEDREQ